MRRTMPALPALVVALALAAPASTVLAAPAEVRTGEIRREPQRVEFKTPAEAEAHAATAAQSGPAGLPAPPRDPALASLDEHRAACQERRIDRGGDVGGIAKLGVQLGSEQVRAAGRLTPEVEALMLQWDGWGAFVAAIVEGSPAEEAGLLAGDVVVQYAGLWVESYPVLQRLASRSEIGREYEIRYVREGVLHTTFLFPAAL